MTKSLGVLLIAVLSNTLLYAQISTSISTTDSGQLQLTISNTSSKAITAYLWSRQEAVTQPDGHTISVNSEHLFDSIGSHLRPVFPGENRIAGTSSDAHAKLNLVTAIFDDGSSFGSSEGAATILRHRTDELSALAAILSVVENLSEKDLTSAAVQQQRTCS